MDNSSLKKLSGGVAVITGAGGGLGSSLAHQASSLGMTVIVADINLKAAEQTALAIEDVGGKAKALRVDVSSADEVQTMAENIFSTYGAVRLLINNAGIDTLGLCWEIGKGSVERMVSVNVNGVLNSIRAFVPRMIASNEESWLSNVSSIGAFSILPTQSIYVATKAAVQSLTECLYLELELHGSPIHVSTTVPGLLRTKIFHSERKQTKEMDRLEVFQAHMGKLAEEEGMDLDIASRTILEQIVNNKFWVLTHPDVTETFISKRVEYLRRQEIPSIVAGVKTQFDF